MRPHLRIIVLALLSACPASWAAPPAPQANCPEETFRFNNQLMPLKAEIEQGTWKEAADRLGALIQEAGDELIAVDGGTVSFSTWVRGQPYFTNPALAEAYEKLFEEDARRMLDVARLGAAHRPADLAMVAHRYPLTPTARVALAAAADRALDLGDAVAAGVFYEKAVAAGWKPDDQHAKRISTLAPLKTPKRLGRLPMEAKWYGEAAKWPEVKVLPLLAGNAVFVESAKGLNVVADGGNSLWNWAAVKPVEGTTEPANAVDLVARGSLNEPGVLLGLDGLPQIVVSRQPQSQSSEFCLRAFRARDGRPLWTTDGDETFATTMFVGQPLVSGGSVYCVAANDGPQGVQLILLALDIMTGSLQWQRPLAAIIDSPVPHSKMTAKVPPRPGVPPPKPREVEDLWAQSAPAIDESCIYVSPNIGCVIAVGRFDGKIRWTRRYPSLTVPDDRYPTKAAGMEAKAAREFEFASRLAVRTRFSNTPAVAGKVVVVAPYDFGGALGLDKDTGKILWESRDNSIGTLLGATEKTAVFAKLQVSAIDAETGRDRWRQDPSKVQKLTGPSSLIGGFVYAPTAAGMVVWDAEDGRVITSAPKLPDGSKIQVGP